MQMSHSWIIISRIVSTHSNDWKKRSWLWLKKTIMALLLPHCWCCLSPCLTPMSREAPPLCPPLPITLPCYLPRTALVITQNHLHHWHTCALSSFLTGMQVPGLFFIPSTSSVLTTVCLACSRRSVSDCSQNQPQGPKLQIRFIPGCCPRTLL